METPSPEPVDQERAQADHEDQFTHTASLLGQRLQSPWQAMLLAIDPSGKAYMAANVLEDDDFERFLATMKKEFGLKPKGQIKVMYAEALIEAQEAAQE